MLRGGRQQSNTTKARLAQQMFNPDSEPRAGTLRRPGPVLVVLLAVCLRTASFSPGPVHAESPVCQVPDLMLYMFGQGATMHFVGGFVLRNIGAQPCVVPPITHIEPLDSGGDVVPLGQIYNGLDRAKSVLLPPDQQVIMNFSFPTTKELCPSQSFRAVSALGLSAAGGGYQYIFKTGVDGAWLICDAPNAGLNIVPFGEPAPPLPQQVVRQLPLTGTGSSAPRPTVPKSILFALSGLFAASGFMLARRSTSRTCRDTQRLPADRVRVWHGQRVGWGGWRRRGRTPCAPTDPR